jgi:predicted SnoaL-like aldol condensation-catalyzing enzyme
MFKSLFVALTALTAGATAADTTQSTSTAAALPAGPYCPSFPVTPEQQRAIFDKFTEHFLVTAKFHTAFSQHVASTYIQHNPFILSGRDTILKFFPKDTADPAAAGYPANIITQSLDTKTQIAQFHYYFTPAPGTQPSVTVDIFRMNGSCIEEHWDVSMDRPANAPNPLAMFTPKN